MGNDTRSGDAQDMGPLPEGFEASIRATWEAGYRAAMRDEFGGEGDEDAQRARDAWTIHGEDGTRYV